MKKHPPRAASDTDRVIRYFGGVFQEQLDLLKRQKASIIVPATDRLFEAKDGMAYHFKPELFIQTGGYTDFDVPGGHYLIRSGEVCVMPKGVPHSERIGNDSMPFENVVMCLYNNTVTLHVAQEGPDKLPRARDIFFFRSPYFDDFVTLLNCLAKNSNSNLAGSKLARTGLMTAVFGLLLNMLESERGDISALTNRIYHCHWLIRHRLNQSDLTVAWLAERLGCSPNHLSREFHSQVGEKVNAYINRIRLQNAKSILSETTLSIKETAFACGFADPNYFSRQFRNAFDMTPNSFRNQSRNMPVKETQPKVVFSDHKEFHYGYDLKDKLIQPQ